MTKLARLPADDRAPAGDADVGRTPRLRTRYYAFLSYSHKDKELADWLHRELEAFRVPHSLAGKLTANGIVPKRLTPIFRDQQELAAAGDLAEEIKAALAASQFLIVLCSPTAAKSRWTNAEIESFKRTRPEGCVLAAIVAGEPFTSDIPGREQEECFPPALRYKFDRRGRPTSKRAEPLAADFRDGADGKRLAFLKLVAGMLGVGLDDLVQRETTRRHRHLAWLAAGSLAGMAITSGLAVTAIQARDAAREQRREAEGLVAFMLGDLKDKLEPLGRLDVLDSVGTRALHYYQSQDTKSLSDEGLAQRSRALTLVGQIAHARGNLDSAIRFYRAAYTGTEESVRRHPDDPKRLYDHAQNMFWIGYIDYQQDRMEAAAARFRDYQRLAARMVALAPDNEDYRNEQVSANTNLGTVLVEQRRYRDAVATYETSLRLAEDLASAEPRNRDYQKQVCFTLAWVADAREYAGDLEGALAARERQLGVIADLDRVDPQDSEVKRDALTAHRAIGRLLAARGDARAGIEESREAIRISDELFRIEPENTEWLQANAMNRFDLSEIQLGMNDLAGAASTIRSACDIVERLVQRSPSVADWKVTKRAICLTERARLALRQNAPEEALSLATSALAIAKDAPNPIDGSILKIHAMAVESAALQMLGRRDQSVTGARHAIQTVPQKVELRPDEQAELAALQLRAGNNAAARQLISGLSQMGYRHPAYLASIRIQGGRS
jgi:tetratricopeptide (TPR) repeat protein